MYTKQVWQTERHFPFAYLQYLPKEFDRSKTYPLVLFLHGAGERGTDVELAAVHGPLRYVKNEGRDYPFICVAPQCPEGKYWGCYTESLLAFLEDICTTLPVDRQRVYLTGLSMGGTGTWMLAMAAPEKFAAIAPICGTGIYWNSGPLKEVPVCVYHGDCDDIVPLYESEHMVRAVQDVGGDAQLHVCKGIGHDAWEIAYQGDELINWLLSHKRK